MFQLIITVISIALSGLMALTTLNYLNPAMTAKRQVEASVVEAIHSLQGSWDQYRQDNQLYDWQCDTYTTAQGSYEDCERVLSDPGYLPVTGWSSTLFPAYGFLPHAPGDLQWSYGTNPNGWYFCLEGAPNTIQLHGIYRAIDDFAINRLTVSQTCGAVDGMSLDTVDFNSVKATYWIKRT